MNSIPPRSEQAEQRRRLIDAGAAAVVILGIALLFYIDITNPRGVVDGVGYAALVALCARFGRQVLLGATALVTLLIVMAAFLVPNNGISVEGELANRFFAIVLAWIVTG